ncbi:hypothetical protein JY651_06200 [Pyxidicoccus parkwayensis]|uniref:Lipoprotein n=1 Tax=Pyxidicoccus parkwayensis TaxID=2813578 RepID=A0ABX7P042_9BACT|nr:hypothetical protein [Pyxidicoccus parkwaysis]QSQ24540.1 hypothetical protein JY651_06200 [Pyxidicoccus parkwaysis]
MQMKMMGRLLAATLLSVAAGCQGDESASNNDNALGAQEAAASTQCVQRFDGITSCALGGAQLAPTQEGLKVAGLVDASKDGVSGTFAKATRWTQKVDVKFGTAKAGLSLAARAGDQTVGTLKMTPLRDGTSMAVTPSFSGAPGGSAYRVNVYNDGVLQGGTTQQPGAMMIIRDWYDLLRWIVAVFSFDNGYEIIIWKNGVQAAATETIPGACVWRMRNERGTFSVQLADGTVLKGNQIEFVEQIEDGHYPYTDFTAIDVNAAANEFNVLGETFVPAK